MALIPPKHCRKVYLVTIGMLLTELEDPKVSQCTVIARTVLEAIAKTPCAPGQYVSSVYMIRKVDFE